MESNNIQETQASPRTVLITGATSGIGKAIAQELAHDHRLIICGRNSMKVLEESIRHPSAEPLIVDLTDSNSLQAATQNLGSVDAVIHCAGALWMGPWETFGADDWERAFRINVIAAVELTQLLLPGLREKRGQVVFLNSGSGTYTYPGGSIYCATKHALKAFSETLRQEERQYQIRVTSIHPGPVDTPMQQQLRKNDKGPYSGDQYLQPKSIAKSVRMVLEATGDASIDSVHIQPSVDPGKPWELPR